MAEDNLHAGHRERVKSRFCQTGANGFEPHELLELLLFYAIPRADTNEIAHRLIKHFGSLERVLLSSVAELTYVKGVGEHSAILLSAIGAASRLCLREHHAKGDRLNNPESAGQYAMNILARRKYEAFLVICLDAQRRVKYSELLHEGTVQESVVYPRRVAEIALLQAAHSVILAHNHPGGSLAPSNDDLTATECVKNALEALGIYLFDHIIVTDEGYYSFKQQRAFMARGPFTQLLAAEEDGMDKA